MSLREAPSVFLHAEVADFLLDLADKYKHGCDFCKESQLKQGAEGSSVLKAEDVSETSSAATAERYCRICHRESGRWTSVPKKEMHYIYIDDIMEEIFQCCLETQNDHSAAECFRNTK
ncbi:uncharacterized protein RDI95_013896 [Morus bassanus]